MEKDPVYFPMLAIRCLEPARRKLAGIKALQRVRLQDLEMVISELSVEADYLRRAIR
jgi:hypothetical protein